MLWRQSRSLLPTTSCHAYFVSVTTSCAGFCASSCMSRPLDRLGFCTSSWTTSSRIRDIGTDARAPDVNSRVRSCVWTVTERKPPWSLRMPNPTPLGPRPRRHQHHCPPNPSPPNITLAPLKTVVKGLLVVEQGNHLGNYLIQSSILKDTVKLKHKHVLGAQINLK